MTPSLSDLGSAYAAVLAWTAHIDHLKTTFNKIAEDESSLMEKTVWAEELAIGLRVIRNYGMRKLADQYSTDESSKHLISLLNDQAVNPELPLSSKLEDILEKIDLLTGSTDPLMHEPVIYEKLYLTLKIAVSRTLGESHTDELQLTSILSKLLAEFFASQQHNLTSANAFDGLASETTAYLKGDSSPAPCKWEDVFTTLKALLEYHLEVLSTHTPAETSPLMKVSRLREMGNNLMVNTCYPQAIQVYTDAIYACNYTTRAHLPQLYTNRAIAYIGLNCFPEAISDLQKALVYDRTCVPAWTQLAYCQLYMGLTMAALKCNLSALRSISGEIYPYRFPDTELLRREYTEAKAQTVMPQFVQKLVSSTILAVKRAEQQREPTASVQEIATRVRAILARLRAHVQPEDLHYLAYMPDPEAEVLRTTAIRADTVRPSILTPDVVQDIVASANIEASAVTLNGPPQTRTNLPIPVPLVPVAAQLGNPASAPAPAPAPGSPLAENPAPQPNADTVQGNMRGFLNTLGDVIGDVVGDIMQTQEAASPQDTAEHNTAGGDGNIPDAGLMQGHIARALSSVRQALSSGNNGGNVNGGLMEAALRHHQVAIEQMLRTGGGTTFTIRSGTTGPAPAHQTTGTTIPSPENVRIVHPRGSAQGSAQGQATTTTTAHTDGAGDNGNSGPQEEAPAENHLSPEDTEMPDAPDLD